MTEHLSIAIDGHHRVSALLAVPDAAVACFVFAHGAGAGMGHEFMQRVADDLELRGVATFRFQFPYMEQGSRRPDPARLCHATVRAAVQAAAQRLPGLPLVAGGKSFGGRMTSQAQAIEPLPGVRGLVFIGFPLHAAGLPSTSRADHLREIGIPMLFLQGTRDRLADIGLIESLVGGLADRARLIRVADADHSFHVTRKSGRTDDEVRAELLDELAAWVREIVARDAI